ncbi:MAG: DUF1289 domain-containing protein [Pseudomonadota bacterium]
MSKKLPSPCVDVCKYKREGHCVACSMTKAQKKQFKSLKKADQRADFIDMLINQQAKLGTSAAWPSIYAKRCAKKGVTLPQRLRVETTQET